MAAPRDLRAMESMFRLHRNSNGNNCICKGKYLRCLHAPGHRRAREGHPRHQWLPTGVECVVSLLPRLGMVAKQNKGETGVPCSALLPKPLSQEQHPGPGLWLCSRWGHGFIFWSRQAAPPSMGGGHCGHAGRVLLAARNRQLPAHAEMRG